MDKDAMKLAWAAGMIRKAQDDKKWARIEIRIEAGAITCIEQSETHVPPRLDTRAPLTDTE